MLQKFFNSQSGVLARNLSIQHKPLVDDQMIRAVALIESGQQTLSSSCLNAKNSAARGDADLVLVSRGWYNGDVTTGHALAHEVVCLTSQLHVHTAHQEAAE